MSSDPIEPIENRLLATLAQALYASDALGLLPVPLHPDQAASLAFHRGTFPLPTIKIMGRRMVRVADILAFAQGNGAESKTTPRPTQAVAAGSAPRRKRGRPSKAEIAVRAIALGETGHD